MSRKERYRERNKFGNRGRNKQRGAHRGFKSRKVKVEKIFSKRNWDKLEPLATFNIGGFIGFTPRKKLDIPKGYVDGVIDGNDILIAINPNQKQIINKLKPVITISKGDTKWYVRLCIRNDRSREITNIVEHFYCDKTNIGTKVIALQEKYGVEHIFVGIGCSFCWEQLLDINLKKVSFHSLDNNKIHYGVLLDGNVFKIEEAIEYTIDNEDVEYDYDFIDDKMIKLQMNVYLMSGKFTTVFIMANVPGHDRPISVWDTLLVNANTIPEVTEQLYFDLIALDTAYQPDKCCIYRSSIRKDTPYTLRVSFLYDAINGFMYSMDAGIIDIQYRREIPAIKIDIN